MSSRHQETYVKPKVAKEGEKPKSRQILTKLEAPAFHAFARIHLGRTVTEEESHAGLFGRRRPGRSRSGRRGTRGGSMKQVIGALVLVVLVLIIVLRQLGLLYSGIHNY